LRENEPEAFDVIIFGDVLEHTRNPEHILEQARVLLKPHGRIIVSLPNIVNLRVRLKILLGNFEYEESGILDRTHLRFFTKASAKAMIERAGYRVLDSEVSGYSLPRGLIRMFPGLLAVQFVNAAEPIERNS
jgi:2-polyprenyl-3-methyl-5-hydroxy-6-metoxy-1,4-benzoquinol methylase